ncbi:hypothetical protein [Haliscomenobacter sp.]|uniref:hypothetical protein n=1 Tax=Haliscomenobacter sp. TaxID=2717303 RepID=UPI003594382F
MNRSIIPKSIYFRELKKNLDSTSMEKHVEKMQKKLVDNWSNLNLNSGLRPIYLFEEDYNSISAYAVEIHEESFFYVEQITEQIESTLISNEAKFFVRKPMAFFDFEITACRKEECRNTVQYLDSKEDEDILKSLTTGFNKLENIAQIGRQLISRGIIINSIKLFCQNWKIQSLEFRATKKRVHFVDSTNGIVYLGIRKCLEDMFGIDKDEIQMIIEKNHS